MVCGVPVRTPNELSLPAVTTLQEAFQLLAVSFGSRTRLGVLTAEDVHSVPT